MEVRKITIACTKNHQKLVVETAAETLGELKAVLDEKNFDYAGMTFFEGLSKSELTSDESILPKDVPYKGETTNNLVFMLTNPNKKISSGSERSDLYAEVKERGLQEIIKEEYGKNFTMVSNEELKAVIEADKGKDDKYETPVVPVIITDMVCEDKVAREAISALVDTLLSNYTIEDEDADEIREILSKKEGRATAASTVSEHEVESPYSDDELEEIFG